MEDFPIWLKAVVWLIVGSTAVYVAYNIIRGLL
jgi:hypothetical protein